MESQDRLFFALSKTGATWAVRGAVDVKRETPRCQALSAKVVGGSSRDHRLFRPLLEYLDANFLLAFAGLFGQRSCRLVAHPDCEPA
jgi:hypothetical protein